MPRLLLWPALLACVVFASWSVAVADDPKPATPDGETPKAEPAPPVAKTPEAQKKAAEKARIQKAVDKLRPLVSKIRDLPWKRPVEAAVMTRKELRAFMISELAKEATPEDWDRDTRILRRIGLLKPTEDLQQMVLAMYESAIAGFYNPETGKMVVIEGLDVEGQKPTIAHELIHALEDQHFDFEKIEKPYRESDPDRVFAIRCMMEGSAEYGRRRFQDLQPDVARHYYASMAKQTGGAAQQDMLRTTPAYILLTTQLHYQIGPNFVSHLFKKYGYRAGMQRLLDDPPTTQEQVLHPHKWLGAERDYPRKVTWGGDLAAALGKPWKTLDEHSVGELDLALFLDYFMGGRDGRLAARDMDFGTFLDDRSTIASRGWDAGRAQFIENDAKHIIFVQAFAFDTLEDSEEAARLLGEARRKVAGDSWKGGGWQRDDAASVPTMSFDFTNTYGRGRILKRGQELLILDGVPADSFDKAWAVFEKTTFPRHTADQGDTAADPFAGLELVDRRRGLGLKLPKGWTGSLGGRRPATFATVRKGEVTLTYTVIRREVSAAGLPQIAQMLLGRIFSAGQASASSVMGETGLQHPLPTPAHIHGVAHFACDLTRTYIVTVAGPKAQVAAAAEDIKRLMDGMPGPIAEERAAADPDLEGSAPPAGLRSIPGY